MSTALFVIQAAAGSAQIERALDTALVAAIFGTHPQLISFIKFTDFVHATKQTAATEKLVQLRELHCEILFTENLPPRDLQILFADSDRVFSF